MENSNHILFIGGLGTIGLPVVKGLRKLGKTVSVADYVHSGEHFFIDIRDKNSIQKCIADAEISAGPIDAVINCAYPKNKNYGQFVENVTFEDFSENVSWHLGGYFLVLQQTCLHLSQSDGGTVISFSSIYGSMAPRFEIYADTSMTMPVEYAAIKAGIMQLSRYFAQLYKKQGVRVNTISPGGIKDGQDQRFLNAYEDYAGKIGMLPNNELIETVAFLSGNGARAITGQDIIIDDGFSL